MMMNVRASLAESCGAPRGARRIDRALCLPTASSLRRAQLVSLGAEFATLAALAADDLAAVLYAGLVVSKRLGRAAAMWPVGVLERALAAAACCSAPADLSALRAALGSAEEEARWAAGGRAAFLHSAAFVRVARARAAEGVAPLLGEFDADWSRPLGNGGHAVVYLATRRASGVRYALKFPLGAEQGNEDADVGADAGARADRGRHPLQQRRFSLRASAQPGAGGTAESGGARGERRSARFSLRGSAQHGGWAWGGGLGEWGAERGSGGAERAYGSARLSVRASGEHAPAAAPSAARAAAPGVRPALAHAAQLFAAEAAALRLVVGCVAVVRLAYAIPFAPDAPPALALELCAAGSVEALLRSGLRLGGGGGGVDPGGDGGWLFAHADVAGGAASGHARLTHPAAAYVAARTIVALRALHSAGVVWRDCKPANILLTQAGHVRICDLALAAKLLPAGDASGGARRVRAPLGGARGATGEADADAEALRRQLPAALHGGTIGFLAPELLVPRAGSLDADGAAGEGPIVSGAADYWALGVTLYVMLTGKHPHARLIPPSEREALRAAAGVGHSPPVPPHATARAESARAGMPLSARARDRASGANVGSASINADGWGRRLAALVLECPIAPPSQPLPGPEGPTPSAHMLAPAPSSEAANRPERRGAGAELSGMDLRPSPHDGAPADCWHPLGSALGGGAWPWRTYPRGGLFTTLYSDSEDGAHSERADGGDGGGVPAFSKPARAKVGARAREASAGSGVPFLRSELSPAAAHVLRALLASDPRARLGSADGAMAHPFFAQPGRPFHAAPAPDADAAESSALPPCVVLFDPAADPPPPPELARAAREHAAFVRARTNRPLISLSPPVATSARDGSLAHAAADAVRRELAFAELQLAPRQVHGEHLPARPTRGV